MIYTQWSRGLRSLVASGDADDFTTLDGLYMLA